MTTKNLDRNAIVLMLLGALHITTSCKCSFEHTQTRGSGQEAKRVALAAIKEGMDEAEVLQQLGNPDEVRLQEIPRIENEAYRWVYGVRASGEFANIGVVIFATNKIVLRAYCPTMPRLYRNQAIGVPIVNVSERTKAGLYCVIESVETAEIPPDSPSSVTTLVNSLHYSLVNDGTSNYVFRQPSSSWIKFNLVVEVFDSARRLILREDYSHYASGDISRMEDWETVSIPPGERVSEDFPIWLTDVYYGKPNPGRYFVRVLFPFQRDRFYSSNLMEFRVP